MMSVCCLFYWPGKLASSQGRSAVFGVWYAVTNAETSGESGVRKGAVCENHRR